MSARPAAKRGIGKWTGFTTRNRRRPATVTERPQQIEHQARQFDASLVGEFSARMRAVRRGFALAMSRFIVSVLAIATILPSVCSAKTYQNPQAAIFDFMNKYGVIHGQSYIIDCSDVIDELRSAGPLRVTLVNKRSYVERPDLVRLNGRDESYTDYTYGLNFRYMRKARAGGPWQPWYPLRPNDALGSPWVEVELFVRHNGTIHMQFTQGIFDCYPGERFNVVPPRIPH